MKLVIHLFLIAISRDCLSTLLLEVRTFMLSPQPFTRSIQNYLMDAEKPSRISKAPLKGHVTKSSQYVVISQWANSSQACKREENNRTIPSLIRPHRSNKIGAIEIWLRKAVCLNKFYSFQANTTVGDFSTELDMIHFLLFYKGMETSLSSLCQAFLDLLHDKALSKRIQSQIDANFEPGEQITLKDRYD